jgi:hypothetical protein
MDDPRSYFKLAGHCTRCGDPFGGNHATAFMVREYVVWQVLGGIAALCQYETAPVCEACVTVKEQANATVATTCKGCGLPMLAPEWRIKQTCSTRCAQRELRLRLRHKKRMCATCGLKFETTRTDAKFCSGACRKMAYRAATAA